MYIHVYINTYTYDIYIYVYICMRAGLKKREVNRILRHILAVIRNCESYI